MANVLGLSVQAAAAYSTRKVRSDYTGSALRVRRSSDNTESDIGFDGSGNLDVQTLGTFAGSGSAFVTKWYDQSGNARDAVQATTAEQPRIVNAGTVETKAGLAVLRFLGGFGHSLLPAYKFAAPSANWTGGWVASAISNIGNDQNVFFTDGTGYQATGIYGQIGSGGAAPPTVAFNRSGGVDFVNFGTAGLGADTLGALVMAHTSGNSATGYLNGTAGSATAVSWTAGAQSTTNLGVYDGGSVNDSISLAGHIAEHISWASVLSSGDLSTLYTSQSTYWLGASGPVTHTGTGALAGGGATVAGVAAHLKLHGASGALVGGGAAVAGTAARTRAHAGSGVLVGAGASLSGAATRAASGAGLHIGTGAIVGGGAAIAGVAARKPPHPASGALVGGGAAVAGVATVRRTHTGTGALVGGGAVLIGIAGKNQIYAQPIADSLAVTANPVGSLSIIAYPVGQ